MRMISFVRSVRWCVVIFYIVKANKTSSFVEMVWPKIQKFRQIRVFSLYSFSFIRKRLSNENICDLWIVLGDNQQSTFNIQQQLNHSKSTFIQFPIQIQFMKVFVASFVLRYLESVWNWICSMEWVFKWFIPATWTEVLPYGKDVRNCWMWIFVLFVF